MRFPRFTTLQLLLVAALCALILGLATTSWRASGYSQVTAVRYSPSGNYLAAHYVTGSVRVWSIENNRPKLTAEIPANNSWAYEAGEQLSFVDDTTLLDIEFPPASSQPAFKATVRTMDIRSGAVNRPFSFPATGYVGMYAAGGNTLAVVNLPGKVDCFRVSDGRLIQRFDSVGTPSYGLSLTPDGRTLAVPDQNGKIHVCDVSSGRTLFSLPANGVGTATISRDGQRLAHVGWPPSNLGSHVRLYQFPATVPEVTMHLDYLHPTWVAFTADGSQLAVAGYEAAEIYDLDHDRILGRIVLGDLSRPSWSEMRGRWRSGGGFSPFALSPNGRTLASFDGGDVLLWDTHSGQLRHRIANHSRIPQILIFSLGFIGWGVAWGMVSRRQRPATTQHEPPLELKLIWGMMLIGGLFAVAVPVTLLVIQGPLLWPGIYYALGVGLVLIVGSAGRRTSQLQRIPTLQMFNLLACDPVNFVLGALCKSLLRRPHVQQFLAHANRPAVQPVATDRER